MKRGGGQGRGPDPAEKPGFSNFFGHFGLLARPMESRVDFLTFHVGAISAAVPSIMAASITCPRFDLVASKSPQTMP